MQLANAFGLVAEDERRAEWGGSYSIYTSIEQAGPAEGPRATFAQAAAKIGSIELELAATAAYLKAEEGYSDPWNETARRKPEKADNRNLQNARQAYMRLRGLPAGARLPDIG
jgi:hypothetical protein